MASAPHRKQRREELEKEVALLQKMLDHEKEIHDYLHHHQDNSAFTIPNFLPPQMKQTLAELSVVEGQIMQLQRQIKHLQVEVKHQKEANIETKYKEWTRHESSPLPQDPNVFIPKRPVDTKAMHFINKAIKGDYNLSDFTTSDTAINANENKFHEGVTLRDKISKKSGIQKPPSPLREPRQQTTPRRDRNLEMAPDILNKVTSTPLHSEEDSIRRWPPNKLSENIMKCLIFIFVRLLRTSRVMELEKSGPIARSTNFSSSFRTDSSSNSKTGPIVQKDSRQQDPYSIFDSEQSIPRDIGPYKNLVRLTSTSMDLKCIHNSSSLPLLQKLRALMEGLQKVDVRFLNYQQKLAFWINMYNACIMHGYLQYGVPSVFTPDNLIAITKKATLNISGNIISAQTIENIILRKPQDSPAKEIIGDHKESTIGELYGVDVPDPNVTFSLCCGTRSSPAVKIYRAEGVISELEKSKLEYLQAAIVVTNTKRIGLPELLFRNMKELAGGGDTDSLMEWVCQQLPASGSLRKSIVDCFRGRAAASVEKIPYEFEFQYLLAI